MYYIGIDNGVSGTIGILSKNSLAVSVPTPTRKEQNYTKTKKWVSRIDAPRLHALLEPYAGEALVLLERPMVNPGRFVATGSALRALEATLIVLEGLKLKPAFIDSKEWQKALLPPGLKGEALKSAAIDVAYKLFPHLSRLKDADGLLIAEYCRRKNGGQRK